MARKTAIPTDSPSLAEAARLFKYHIEGQRLSPRTVGLYMNAIGRLERYLVAEGKPTTVATIGKRDVQAFIWGMKLEDGKPASAGYISTIARSLGSLFSWAVGEDDMGVKISPMVGWKAPAVTAPVVRYPTEDELRALLATCRRKRSYLDARDEALMRLLIDTGCRLSEIASLRLGSIDLDEKVISVIGKRSKGRERPRIVPFGSKTAASLDRYLNKWRPGHFYLEDHKTDALWLGHSGPLTANGLAQAVKERARTAGLPWLHAHAFRHRFTGEHLRAGMEEGDVMALTGHTSHSMLLRYGAATRTERAIAAYRRIPVPEV